MENFSENDFMDMNFSTVGVIVSYDHTTRMAKVRPMSKRLNNSSELDSPILHDVPVAFPVFDNGTGYVVHPLKAGDPVLLVHVQRSIEDWKQGIDGAPEDPRVCDMNDCFAQPIGRVHNSIDTDGTCIDLKYGPTQFSIYNNDLIVIKGNIQHEGNYTQKGSMDRTGDTVLTGETTQTGNSNQTGTHTVVGGEVIANGIPLSTHMHQDTKQEKGSVSGKPIP